MKKTLVVLLRFEKTVGKWIKPRQWVGSRRQYWSFALGGKRWELVSDPLIGTWYAGYLERGVRYDSLDHWPGFKGLFMLPKKKQSKLAAEVDHLASVESVLLKKYAPLLAHVAATRYDDATPRKPGTLTISVQGDMWCVTANDVDTAKRVRALAPDIDKAVALASALVASPDTPWEDAPWLAQDAVKKKK